MATYDIIQHRIISAKEWEKLGKRYQIKTASNGVRYIDWTHVQSRFLHLTAGNDKTGPMYTYNVSIEHSCDHRCGCYKQGKCYGCTGCYLFTSNQRRYAENYSFFRNHTNEEIIEALDALMAYLGYKAIFRWFTIGDTTDTRFADLEIAMAERHPDIKFYQYTKKYSIWNNYIANHGHDYLKALPENFRVIFSHWLNDDGTYFPMANPYNAPTSEFIPAGMEQLAALMTWICPCSNPESIEHCSNCTHGCYNLLPGQHMALMEHSTQRTKERDKEIRKAKKALKAALKAAKK